MRMVGDNRGFTLLDVAVSMLIISLLSVPLLQQFNRWQTVKAAGDTNDMIRQVDKAIADFYYLYNRYPCPADPRLRPGDANYGHEECNPGSLPPVADNTILSGALPFVDLRISEDQTIDGWRRKLLYTVSAIQTAAPAPVNGGAITVTGFNRVRNPGAQDSCDRTATINYAGGTEPLAHYVLFSAGENGMGGYAKSGRQVQQCVANGGLEAENCDGDATFVNSTCAFSKVAGPDFYDDKLAFQNGAPSRIWAPSRLEGEEENIFTSPANIVMINTPSDVAATDPGSNVNVYVSGNLRAQRHPTDTDRQGRLFSRQNCNEEGDDCFLVDRIAGSGMSCAGLANTGMTGVARQDTLCNVRFAAGSAGSCPSGQYAIGFSAGRIVCSP